ncbi:MAG TPA: plastocyanin/azurin family copper-binding protein [Nitrososphaeraceae archaeon]|jgi:plastocyanin|nr:plastocyanin/azurin family copper-binding protein [Nitrososphaeraceae archaeon]
MKDYIHYNIHEYHHNKNKIQIGCTSIVIALLVTHVLTVSYTIFFRGEIVDANAIVYNQSMTKNNAATQKVVKQNDKQILTLGNITKLTTTQGNITTNANAASPFPIKEANSTKVFPPSNKVAIVLGAALKRDKAYQPNPVNVKSGGTVVWTNEDTVAHTVTSGSGFNDQNLGREFDSGFLGKSFSHIFFKPGVFPYFCEIHPTMIGKVVVK